MFLSEIISGIETPDFRYAEDLILDYIGEDLILDWVDNNVDKQTIIDRFSITGDDLRGMSIGRME